jgi:hypothetical protein
MFYIKSPMLFDYTRTATLGSLVPPGVWEIEAGDIFN